MSGHGLLFPVHAVDALDHQERCKGSDDKADDDFNEDPQVEGTAPPALAEGGMRTGTHDRPGRGRLEPPEP